MGYNITVTISSKDGTETISQLISGIVENATGVRPAVRVQNKQNAMKRKKEDIDTIKKNMLK